MLERASGSLPNYPGDPPAAAGGLGSAGTRSHSGPSEAARLRRTAAACSKRYDPLFWHDVKGADGLGSPGYQTGTVRASTGRVWTGDVAELRGSWETAKFHTVLLSVKRLESTLFDYRKKDRSFPKGRSNPAGNKSVSTSMKAGTQPRARSTIKGRLPFAA